MEEEKKLEQLEVVDLINSQEEVKGNSDALQSNVGETDNDEVNNINNSGSNFGKFNSAEDLLTAYNNLQAEFTRKCQKLSELKKSDTGSQQCEYLSNDWDDKVAQFISQNQNAKRYAKEICDVLLSDSTISQSKDSLNLAYQKVLSSKYKEPDELLKDEEFIKKIVSDSNIRNLVLEHSLKGVSMPPSVMGRSGASLISERHTPNSIDEAGQIVLGLFKSKK